MKKSRQGEMRYGISTDNNGDLDNDGGISAYNRIFKKKERTASINTIWKYWATSR